MSAVDQGVPPRSANTTATVTINVDRNLYSPVFVNPNTYTANISENLRSGSDVIQVSTTDNDTTVRCLLMVLFHHNYR